MGGLARDFLFALKNKPVLKFLILLIDEPTFEQVLFCSFPCCWRRNLVFAINTVVCILKIISEFTEKKRSGVSMNGLQIL